MPACSAGEWENQQTALAGDDDGEEAAVGGDGEVAEADAAENGNRQRLRDGDILS